MENKETKRLKNISRKTGREVLKSVASSFFLIAKGLAEAQKNLENRAMELAAEEEISLEEAMKIIVDRELSWEPRL